MLKIVASGEGSSTVRRITCVCETKRLWRGAGGSFLRALPSPGRISWCTGTSSLFTHCEKKAVIKVVSKRRAVAKVYSEHIFCRKSRPSNDIGRGPATAFTPPPLFPLLISTKLKTRLCVRKSCCGMAPMTKENRGDDPALEPFSLTACGASGELQALELPSRNPHEPSPGKGGRIPQVVSASE